MILDAESWMNIRRFRVLHEAGASYAEIARECGCDWRTVRKYLAEDGVPVPPRAPSRVGTQPQGIAPRGGGGGPAPAGAPAGGRPPAAGDRPAGRGGGRVVAPGHHRAGQRDP